MGIIAVWPEDGYRSYAASVRVRHVQVLEHGSTPSRAILRAFYGALLRSFAPRWYKRWKWGY